MNKMIAIAGRILQQFRHDRRTLALLFIAPIIVLWLLSVLLGNSEYIPKIAETNLPNKFVKELNEQNADIVRLDTKKAWDKLKKGELDAVLSLPKGKTTLQIHLEGSDGTANAAVINVVSGAMEDFNDKAQKDMKKEIDRRKKKSEESIEDIKSKLEDLQTIVPGGVEFDLDDQDLDIDMDKWLPIRDVIHSYIHGSDDWANFDFFGPIFIALFLFVFTFITSGMSLVNEKSTGTMARFLATPVRSWQILGGYAIGFGAFAAVQVGVIVTVALKVIGFPNEGNVAYIILTAVSLAIASVTLGLLVSGLASNAFQVVQLMLLFVVPQILLCGLFDLSGAPGWMKGLSSALPLTYGADAMKEVMLRGSGFEVIYKDLVIVWGFTCAFFILASLGFRKKRAK